MLLTLVTLLRDFSPSPYFLSLPGFMHLTCTNVKEKLQVLVTDCTIYSHARERATIHLIHTSYSLQFLFIIIPSFSAVLCCDSRKYRKYRGCRRM